jgi:hypothetical protein
MKGFSQRASRFDVGGACSGEPAPVSKRVRGQFGAVVHAHQLGASACPGHDLVQDPDGVVGVDGTVDLDGEGLLGELVGDGQYLQRPKVGGLVEQEVDGPHLVGTRRPQAVGRDRGDADPVALLGAPEDAKSLVTAQALDALVVDAVPLVSQQGGHAAIAVARTQPSEGPETRPEALFFVGHRWSRTSLGGTGLAQESAGPALGEPVSVLDHLHRPTAPCRAQNFPSATSFNAAMSRAWSATMRFNRVFWCSSSFRRFTSSTCIEPYCWRQR